MYLPVFIIYSFFLRFYLFFKHWYLNGFLYFAGKTISLLEFFDNFFALKTTALNLFKPLYQDYSLVGSIIGPVFRTCLLLVGSLLYLSIVAIALFIFLLWASLPLFLIYSFLKNIFFFNFL